MYISEFCRFDMCKIYGSFLSAVHDRYKKDPMLPENHFAYLYGMDGNTHFAEDAYGEAFVVAPFADLLEATRQDSKKSDYRRYKWLLGFLEALKDTGHNEETVGVFYGS